MGLGKLIKRVESCVEYEGRKKRERCEGLNKVLTKLEEKEAKILKKLSNESDNKKQKQLKLESKIIGIQLKKGRKYLAEVSQ